jgi:hypothetical protein
MFELILDNAYMQVHCHDVAPPSPITSEVLLTRGRFIDRDTSGTSIDNFIDFPSGWPVVFKQTVYSDPTNDHLNNTFLYPVEWDGHDSSGTDFIPETPTGYSLSEIVPFVKGYITGGAQDTITVDTSGWGYLNAPSLSPYLVSNASEPYSIDAFPTTDPTDPILCSAGFNLMNEQFQSPLMFIKWYPSGPGSPPYSSDPRQINMTEWGLRFVFNPD